MPVSPNSSVTACMVSSRVASICDMEPRRRRRVLPRLSFNGSVLLRDAAVNNDASLLSDILSKRFNLRVSRVDVSEALLKACRHGSLECADLLLREDIHVDYQDEDLWTPLHVATASSHEKVVELLIQNNADATLLDVDAKFAVDYAVDPRIKDLLLQYLAESGVYSEDLPSIRSRLPKAMFAAVSNGIQRRKNLNNHNKNGVSPLHTAAANGYLDIAQMLIDSRVDINCHDDQGLTPLYIAVKYCQTNIARLLVLNGADTSVIDPKKLRALEESSSHLEQDHHNVRGDNGQPQQSRLLLSKVSDISYEDKQKEAEHLRKFGYTGKVQDQEARLQALSVALSFASNLPEMIYDDLSNLKHPVSSTNSTSEIEEQYDTSVNMRKLVGVCLESDSSMDSMNGVSTNHLKTYEDELYDDAKSIRHRTNGHTSISDEEQLYDDTQSISRAVERRNRYSSSSNTFCHESENLYDDAISMNSAISRDSGTNQVSNRSDGIFPSASNVTYSTATDTRPQVPQPRPHVPRPYEEIHVKLRSKAEYEGTSNVVKQRQHRKMTKRRSKLPSLDSSEPPPTVGSRHQRPLGPSVSVDNYSPNQSPNLKRSPVSQTPLGSPNVPIAWQYRMNALSKETEPKRQEGGSSLQEPEPRHPVPQHRLMVQEKRGKRIQQQKEQLFTHSHLQVSPSSPITSKPSPILPPKHNRYLHNQPITPYASVATSSPLNSHPSSDPHLSCSVSPTYMTIPDRPPLQYSCSVTSAEEIPTPLSPRSRAPGDNKEEVTLSLLQHGIRKMNIRNGVSAGFHPWIDLDGGRVNVKSSSPKPFHVSNQFQ